MFFKYLYSFSSHSAYMPWSLEYAIGVESHGLSLKVLSKIVAGDILNAFTVIIIFLEKIGQHSMIHMKYQALNFL